MGVITDDPACTMHFGYGRMEHINQYAKQRDSADDPRRSFDSITFITGVPARHS